MLYPKEDPDTHRLQFACRTCQYSEEALSSCVFRNVLNNAVGETAGVTQDVGSDPTVSLSKFLSRFCLLFYLRKVKCGRRMHRSEQDYLKRPRYNANKPCQHHIKAFSNIYDLYSFLDQTSPAQNARPRMQCFFNHSSALQKPEWCVQIYPVIED